MDRNKAITRSVAFKEASATARELFARPNYDEEAYLKLVKKLTDEGEKILNEVK